MAENQSQIQRLVEAEISRIQDPRRSNAMKAMLVPPTKINLKWGYGEPGERFDCWIVGLSPNKQIRLLYCSRGFGPADPWGIVVANQDWLGMDSEWHVGLEHAAINAGLLPAPPDYEVP